MAKLKKVVFFVLFVFSVSLVLAKEETSEPTKFLPTTVEVDRNYDGKVDRREYYEAGVIVKTETDTDFDGIFDETVYFKNGKPVKAEKDTNKDGKPDTWITY